MNFPFIYFLIEGTLYSIGAIIRKTLVNQFTVPNYIITNFLFRVVIMIPYIIYYWVEFTSTKNMDLIYKNSHVFGMLAILTLIGGIIYMYIIKNTPISYAIPMSFMISNILITVLGITYLGEKTTYLRIIGLLMGTGSLFLLA